MNQRGGSRGSGHLWAGMGAPSLRDAPPLTLLYVVPANVVSALRPGTRRLYGKISLEGQFVYPRLALAFRLWHHAFGMRGAL